MAKSHFIMALVAMAALTGCGTNSQADVDQDRTGEEPTTTVIGSEASTQSPEAEPTKGVSILRADIEQPETPPAPLEPLNAIIGFPDGGAGIDEAASMAIMQVTSSEQLMLQGPIVLRGHSDAGGSDAANERASMTRAESVRDFMIDLGVDEDRFTIIAFGEQNPIEPNALPDGTPNEEGRARNRRVEILIIPPEGERIEGYESGASLDQG
ncbi:OmpA family protein [Erythrobacter sp. Alg231-14]|uniref:OmpA family protein n=1 Tax=Erythrobacter sp. Alg231-14 TaxID=1922225 RepID=UPI00307C9774